MSETNDRITELENVLRYAIDGVTSGMKRCGDCYEKIVWRAGEDVTAHDHACFVPKARELLGSPR